jgi:hypothetical protein
LRRGAPIAGRRFCCHAAAIAAFAGQEDTMFEMMRTGGFNMFVLAAIGLVMAWTAIQFARGADPHRLSILRALTIAEVFASASGFIAGLIKTFGYVGDLPGRFEDHLAVMAIGFAESCTNLVFGGAFVVITWILVAVGVRRMPHDPA